MPLEWTNTDDKMRYGDNARTLEVTLELKHRASGRETEASFDNLYTPMTFMVQNGLWPSAERLDQRLEILLSGPERELPGLEGTVADGLTGQGLLDAYRAGQGSFRLVIEVDVEDEAALDEFDTINWD